MTGEPILMRLTKDGRPFAYVKAFRALAIAENWDTVSSSVALEFAVAADRALRRSIISNQTDKWIIQAARDLVANCEKRAKGKGA